MSGAQPARQITLIVYVRLVPGHAPEQEIRILLLHGVLHCLGHDHETDSGQMARLERKLQGRWIGPR